MIGSRPRLARLGRRAPGPGAQRAGCKRLFDRIGNAVGNYVAGALGQALIAGVLAYIVLPILGVPYAGSLAVVIFLLDLVPLVGATLGAILVGIITLFNDFPTDDDHLGDLVDRLPAGREQRHPAADPGQAVRSTRSSCSSSVLFGSTLFGVLGALLAIPVAAAIQISIIEYNRLRSRVDRAVQAPPPPASPTRATGGAAMRCRCATTAA